MMLRTIYWLVAAATIAVPIAVAAFWPQPIATGPPKLRDLPGYHFATEKDLSSWDDPRISRRADEDDLDFVTRVTQNIFNANYHCSYDAASHSWATWVAARIGLLDLEYGVLTLETLQCGFCHQHSFILATALRNGGIDDAVPYGLEGHVVTVFHLDGKRYAVDPDFNVGPFHFPNDPDLIRTIATKEYGPLTEVFGDSYIESIVATYPTTEDNSPYPFEKLAKIRLEQKDLLKWERPIEIGVLAFGLCLVSLGLWARRRR